MTGATATAGRHPLNDLVLDDRLVSGVHLRFSRIEDRLRVRDAESTNGTWLGNARIFEAEIAPGTELRLGESRILVDTDDVVVPQISTLESFGELVGRCPAMRETFSTIDRIAPKEISVLVSGDTGTGKEEVARAIHARSGRTGPFVPVDATALPELLAEKLLFGDESGTPEGLFASAAGGTLFLDNVGEFSPAVQARLLRVLEDKKLPGQGGIERLLDARIISATSRDLRHAIDEKTFRDDLYFRLAQLRITLPPLRDRPEDVPLLVEVLLARIASAVPFQVPPDTIEYLQRQAWTGNVRELKNVLVAATALATDGVIRRRDVTGESATAGARSALELTGSFADAKERAVVQFESAYLAALMARCSGNLSAAARESHLARHHLRDLLRKRNLYGVDWPPGDGGQ